MLGWHHILELFHSSIKFRHLLQKCSTNKQHNYEAPIPAIQGRHAKKRSCLKPFLDEELKEKENISKSFGNKQTDQPHNVLEIAIQESSPQCFPGVGRRGALARYF